MKNLIKSTIVLTIFSLSIILFQLSCQEEIEAQNNATEASNRFLYMYGTETSETGETTVEFWTAKNDGTDNKKIPITLTAGLRLNEGARLTPDGQTLIFTVEEESTSTNHVYSISINGTGLLKLIDGIGKTEGSDKYFELLQAY